MVIPDLHGSLPAAMQMMCHAGLVDSKGNWCATNGLMAVQLGDLIDRGPDSKACVEQMIRLERQAAGSLICLRGNHEQMLLDAVREGIDSTWAHWNGQGGAETLQSYGNAFESLCHPGGAHYNWLEALPYYFERDGVLFVHGGIEEGNEDLKDLNSLLWSRPPHVLGHFKAVACGHTVGERVVEEEGVFYCDLGLYDDPEFPLEYLVLHFKDGEMSPEIRIVE